MNRELIVTWKTLQVFVQRVILRLEKMPYDKDFYLAERALDLEGLPDDVVAARMIYLNKTGFNGMYRVNSKGKFNVPFGRHKNPLICDRENLLAVNTLLRMWDVALSVEDFQRAIKSAGSGDLVYLDPPYVPLTATANFTAYTPDGFSMDDQERLAVTLEKLHDREVRWILSNSDTEWIHNRYSKFLISTVRVGRGVNSNTKKRGKVGEVLITNF